MTHLRISGVIDETFSSAKFAGELQGHVILDLGRVERISSFGVRKWIEFTSKLPAGTNGLYMINTPPLVVDQLNMVEGFAGVTQILSVLAPYTCPKCGEDFVRLVDVRKENALLQEGKVPEHRCGVCDSVLQFADLPDEFFDYIRHQRPGPLDQSIQRYLNTLVPMERVGEVVSHVKLVHEDITYFRVSNVLKGDLNVRRMSAGLEGRVVYDMAMVTTVEPEAVPKLLQVLDTAAATAQVVLWRVPPPVLTALAKTRKPIKAGISTLYLPANCKNCGSRAPQRVEAAEYLDALAAGEVTERACPICGGHAKLPLLKELGGFLMSAQLVAANLEEFEALEPRALSQYLAGAMANDQAKSDQENTTQPPGGNESSSLRLQVLKRLGQGGMAEVFLARQVGLKGFEKYVVIKKILENFATQPDFVEMLFAEARANARLTHQNIVQTFDVGLMNGVAYITMEFVRGPDVKKITTLLKKAGEKMPIQHAVRIVAETANGLHYAHSYVDPTGTPHPMVHRDVSPHNILLSLDGAIKLSDFGIAKVQGETENTRPGTFKGKIAYLSPEAIAGMQVDARSDVFALGVTLYELLTGRLPFRRENEAATLHAIMREPPVKPSKIDPTIPEDISEIVMRALEKDPANRTPSAGQVRDELEQAMTRHRLNVSPSAVASYFQEKLGAQLTEYSPSSGTGAGTGVNSRPPEVTDPFAPKGAAPGGTAQRQSPPPPAPRQATPQRPVAAPAHTPRPAPVPAPQLPAMEPPPHDRAPPPPPRTTSTESMPAAMSQPRQIAPPPATIPASRRGTAPALAAVAPPASEEVSLEDTRAKLEPAPKRQMPSRVGLPAAAPPAVAPAPAPRQTLSAPLAAPPVPAPVPAAPAAGKKSRLPLIIGAVVFVIAAAGVGAVIITSGGHSDIQGLEAGESLYFDGQRVDPVTAKLNGSQRTNVATAVDGKRRRLGNIPPGVTAINVKTLLEVPPPPDTVGMVDLRTDPAGCLISANGEKRPEKTPISLELNAGIEYRLEISCAGHLPVEKWVMPQDGIPVSLDLKVP